MAGYEIQSTIFVSRQSAVCRTFVRVQGLARVAIHGLTWVNFQNLAGTRVKFRFLADPVNSGRPAWSTVQIRGKLPVATAQAKYMSAGER